MQRAEGALLTFDRADDARVRSVLVRGGLALATGAALLLLCALTERLHLPDGVRVAASLLGLVLFGVGLVSGFYSLPRLLAHDVYIGVRRDGLVAELGEGAELIPWDELEAITANPEGLVLRRVDGPDRVIARTFGGKTPVELARALDDARRKATLNLL